MKPTFDISFIDQMKRFSVTELQAVINQCIGKEGRVHNALRVQAKKELFKRMGI